MNEEGKNRGKDGVKDESEGNQNNERLDACMNE